ncbi:MAG TPA: Flp pilus assembly protein CpaB [Symbiobacteriaceae bacterium]|nr:Flp pilus assembly protein CpaB [Symbiobacteriaceae bacterium]
MMGKWRLRLFWAALVAIITALGVKGYLGSLQETEPIVLAAVEIPARTLITADMLQVVEVNRIDKQRLADNAFASLDEVVGRSARRRIEAGEVLRNRPGDFTEPGAVRAAATPGEGALADFLPPDTRAIGLQVDQQAIIGNHIRPGDRVDLIFTSKSDSTGGVYSSLLMQQVQVLDIERAPADQPEKEVIVTLLLTVEQAVDVALAKRTGVVDLVLNPPDPGAPAPQRVTSPLKFTGQPDAGPVKAATAQPPQPEPTNAAQPTTAKP